MQRSVLVVGDADREEFAETVELLRGYGADRCYATTNLADLIPAESPTWIILLQSRSGQFAAAQLAALRRRYPLARCAAIAGYWTAGELRTGKQLPGVISIPWYLAKRRLAELLESPGGLPPATASAEEAIVRELEKLERVAGLAVIAAPLQSDFQYWADAVESLGMSAVWRTPGGRVRAAKIAAVIYLPGDWGPSEREEAACFLAAHPAASRILGVGLPRWEDRRLAEEVGFTAILGLPFGLRDLQLAISAGQAVVNTAS